MAITLDGTNGLTTPSLSVSGTSTLTGLIGGSLSFDSSGKVGIGTSPISACSLAIGPAGIGKGSLSVLGSDGDFNTGGLRAFMDFDATSNVARIGALQGGSSTSTGLLLLTNGTERMRITYDGTPHFNCTGQLIRGGETFRAQLGTGIAAFITSTAGYPVASFKNTGTNGYMLSFENAGGEIGNVSTSGGTVSYNAFAGSHWSQLKDGSKPEILRGTVLDSIDELCEWPNEEPTERLCKVKISDTVASNRVYGVFMDWDHGWVITNDMLVTSLGAFVCRINKDEVVQVGDLLESNGDGTAKVQTDDVIRSKTIGKVTCTEKTTIHPDGSYCVPTVLYCG